MSEYRLYGALGTSMTRATSKRVMRRQVKRGVIDEIKRRTGRDVSGSAEVKQMIVERILKKERSEAVKNSVDVPLGEN